MVFSRNNNETDPVPLKVAEGPGPRSPCSQWVPLATYGSAHAALCPDGPGFLRLAVTAFEGSTDTVTVRVAVGFLRLCRADQRLVTSMP